MTDCVHNCDDHSLLDFKSAVKYIWNISYITSHNKDYYNARRNVKDTTKIYLFIKKLLKLYKYQKNYILVKKQIKSLEALC